MKLHHLLWIALCAAAAIILGSCKDSKSYAELLNDETKSVNLFLSNQIVILDVPEDSVLEYGPEAPYYRIDPDGNVFLQVIEPGDDEKPKDDDQVFFRFTRYSLHEYAATGQLVNGYGNNTNLNVGNTSFRFNNTTLSSSTQWGIGIQMPLLYVGYNSRVNVIIKSQYGLSSEISQVVPYLYDIRYYKSVSN